MKVEYLHKRASSQRFLLFVYLLFCVVLRNTDYNHIAAHKLAEAHNKTVKTILSLPLRSLLFTFNV